MKTDQSLRWMGPAMLVTLLLMLILPAPSYARKLADPCDPPDPAEPNDTPGSGPALIVGQPQGDLMLSPLGDVDYFLLWGKAGTTYQVTTATSQGVDTRLQISDPGGAVLAANDDYSAGHPASRVTFLAPVEGWYNVRVDSPVPLDWGCLRYSIQVVDLPPTPTPTQTATSTAPTATPVPEAIEPDPYEPNDEMTTAVTTGIGLPINLNFNPYPAGSQTVDQDYFRFSVKPRDWVRIETLNLAAGLDTRLTLYGQNGEVVASNDDCEGARRSCLQWRPAYNGVAYIQVSPVGLLPDPVTALARAYSLGIMDLNLVTPTVTPTGTPEETPEPGTATPQPTEVPAEMLPDPYEPNWDPERATSVGQGQTLNLNFNPWPPGHGGIDNDFFKFSVKVGDRLKIETVNLAPGVDTNIILYRENGQTIAGNDDCTEGQRGSCIYWEADYNGTVYLLVGPVGLVPDPTTAGANAYSLAITNLDMVTPTPSSGGVSPSTGDGEPAAGYGEPAPWPVTPPIEGAAGTPTSTATATPTAPVQVRSFSLAPPTGTPRPLQSVTLDVTIYYDANNNQAPDGEEGVTGIDVRVLDGVSNQVLGQAFTDAYGHVRLTVATADQVRLSVPYLGYNQAVRPPGKELVIRLAALQLPSLIP